ncbi:hypothetical protein CRM22_003999 [Opisthorchis felineus]|uniref:BHLH domain-containing protein n=1 Tax=Opisthorchis felineus TaxID=147828 RepID=A0A4V3SFM1_OPIFE|nr:hypothetical protein CRM22_003999 [Opisthorchis felineus]
MDTAGHITSATFCVRKRGWSEQQMPNSFAHSHENTLLLTDSGYLSAHPNSTATPDFPPIKRVANERERTRTASVNDAFLMLRRLIPTEPMNRKLSKIETLRLASSYISHLHAVLVTGIDPAEQPCLRHQQVPPSGCIPGRCPLGTQEQRAQASKEQHRPVCTFCVTEMKQHQRGLSDVAEALSASSGGK